MSARERPASVEPESMWGDWLPKFCAALDAVEPTPEEKAVLRRAAEIRAAHKARIGRVQSEFGFSQ